MFSQSESSSAQTTVPTGSVSGTWTAAGSPYLVTGSVQIPNGQTLIVEPGVVVQFQSNYQLQVNGRLLAQGNSQDSIKFTAGNLTLGWQGIRFPSTALSNDSSKIEFCAIEFAKGNGTGSLSSGGAINCTNFDKFKISNCSIRFCTALYRGGGIYCENSDAIITNNHFSNNTGNTNGTSGGSWDYGGGAIMLKNSNAIIRSNTISQSRVPGGVCSGIFCWYSNPVIENNTIKDGLLGTSSSGGAIYCYHSTPTIKGNIIYNNFSSNGSGIYLYNSSPTISDNLLFNNEAYPINSNAYGGCIYLLNSNAIFLNNTIVNNHAKYGGGVVLYNSNPTFRNCIIYGNSATSLGNQFYIYDEQSDPTIEYCNIQGGPALFELNGTFYTGLYNNNIDSNPLFTNPTSSTGINSNSSISNWNLLANSPCIDSGDPSFQTNSTDVLQNPRVVNNIVDVGAIENQDSGTSNSNIITVAPGSCENGRYTLNGTVLLSTPPSTGSLTVTNSCGGNITFVAPFPPVLNYSFSNLCGNGQNCTVTATFSPTGALAILPATYAAPNCNSVSAQTSACSNGLYNLSGSVSVYCPPASGSLTITSSCGGSTVLNAPFVNPMPYSINNLSANGNSCIVSAVFSAAGAPLIPSANFVSPSCCGANLAVSVDPSATTICTSSAAVTLTATGPANGGNILTNSTQINIPIPDNGLNGEAAPGTAGQNYSSSALTVTGVCPNVVSASTYIDVMVSLVHPYVGDLVIYLRSPNGTNLLLSSLTGGASDNYTNTHFSTTATTNITAGIAPFTGNFLPEGSFSTLNGGTINGTWTLFVGDDVGTDVGTLLNWSISFLAPTVNYSWSPTSGLSSTNTASTLASPTATTTYTVTATNSCGCSGTASSTITVQGPTASVVAPTTNPINICAGSGNQLNFSGTQSAFLNYTLNGVNGSFGINPTGNALITPTGLVLGLTWPSSTSLIFTSVSTGNGATGCVTPLNIPVNVRPQPAVTNFTVPSTVCSGETATVNISATANTIVTFSFNGVATQVNVGASGIASWTSPALTANATINLTSIAYTTAPLCAALPFTSTNTITVTGSVTPSFSTMGPFCYGDTPNTLPSTSANGVTGTWSPAAISTNTLGSTNYTFTPVSTGCGSAPVVVPVTVNERPLVFAHGANPTCSSLCNGSAVADVTGGTAPYVYSWSNGGTTASLSNLCEGTYTVSVTDANGCQSQDFTPVSGCFQIQSISVDACGLGAEEGLNEMFFIQIGNSALNINSATITWPSNSFTNFNCSNAPFIASANAAITAGGVILPVPASGVLPANANVVIMTSNTPNLAASTFANITDTLYMAFHCASVVAGYFANAFAVGTRTLSMSFGAGCTDQVTYLTSLVPNSDGAYVNFSQSGVAAYLDYDCNAPFSAQNSSVILDAPNAVIPIFNPVGPFCSGAMIPALPTSSSNTPAITGAWTPAINNTTTTTYTFTPNPTTQCANTAQLTITINDGLDFGNLQFPSVATICTGGTINAYGQLFNTGDIETAPPGAAPGVTVQLGYSTSNTNPSTWTNWNNATFNAQAGSNDEYVGTLSNLSAGTYYYTFRYRANNCDWQYGGFNSSGGGFWSASNTSGVLTVTAPPSAGNDGSIALCTNATPINLFNVLSGSPASTGTWSGPSSLSNGNLGTFNPSVNTGGQYTYTVTAPGCADDIATVGVSLNTAPSAIITNATGTTQLGCSVQSINLIASGGTSYSWSGGLGNTAAVSIQQPGTYTVTVTNGNGCANTASITISGNGGTLPTASVSGNPSICHGSTAHFEITGTPNSSVSLSVNGTGAAVVSLNALGFGTYQVVNSTSNQTIQLISVTDGNCINALSVSYTIVVSPLLTAALSAISPICAGTDAVTNFLGPPNGTIAFTLNGNPMTITLGGDGAAQNTVVSAIQPILIELISVSDGICSNTVSGSSLINISFDASCGFETGCLDPLACNFNATAITDDGSCTYPGCNNPSALNYNTQAGCDDGSCIYPSGCTDVTACNYDVAAVNDDGSCTYPGCTNPSALNYSAQAGCDDGSCIYPGIPGCLDPSACNYNSQATYEDFSCVYPGCLDGSACNYNPTAGCDDGQCIYPGCTDFGACNYDANAGCSNGSCQYPGCLDPIAINYNPSAGCDDGSCTYSGITGCTDPAACNYNSQATYEDFSCVYPGCVDGSACNYNPSAGCDDGSCSYPGCLDPSALNYNAQAGCDDGSCLFVSGCIDPASCNYNSQAAQDDGSCTYPGCTNEAALNFNPLAGCDDGSCLFVSGCMDPLACNYNSQAGQDDGSCTYPGCTQPEACNYDATAGCDDGSCLTAGCTDFNACNYDPQAACEDNSCEYLEGAISGPQLVFVSDESEYTYPCDAGCEYVWTVSDFIGTDTLAGFVMGPNNTCEVTIAWGNYTGITNLQLEVTCDNGCSSTYEYPVQVDTGLEELQAGSVLLYPNPTNDIVTLSVSNHWLGGELRVRGLLGNLIMETTLTQLQLDLDASSWAAGVYVVEIEIEGHIRNTRMVKQ